MTLVRIIKTWPNPPLLQQTPNSSGRWGDIEYTLDPVERCDYVLVLQRLNEPVTVECPPNHVWAFMEEPPNEAFKAQHRAGAQVHRVYTTDPSLRGSRYVKTMPALPWHVGRSYDELVQAQIPEKQQRLSWITSNLAVFQGHRARLAFLERVRANLDFDLYGRGFTFIEKKWDGLAPYQYALAIENYSNPYYWTEKLADCFLSWTMPIYYGCTRIHEYFPKEALIQIDINDPDAIEQIRAAVASDAWKRNLEAIAYARELVLERYQFFPFISNEIRAFEQKHAAQASKQLTLTNTPRWSDSLEARVRFVIGRYVTRNLRRAWASLRG